MRYYNLVSIVEQKGGQLLLEVQLPHIIAVESGSLGENYAHFHVGEGGGVRAKFLSLDGLRQFGQNMEVCPYCGGYVYTRYFLLFLFDIHLKYLRPHHIKKEEEEGRSDCSKSDVANAK